MSLAKDGCGICRRRRRRNVGRGAAERKKGKLFLKYSCVLEFSLIYFYLRGAVEAGAVLPAQGPTQRIGVRRADHLRPEIGPPDRHRSA